MLVFSRNFLVAFAKLRKIFQQGFLFFRILHTVTKSHLYPVDSIHTHTQTVFSKQLAGWIYQVMSAVSTVKFMIICCVFTAVCSLARHCKQCQLYLPDQIMIICEFNRLALNEKSKIFAKPLQSRHTRTQKEFCFFYKMFRQFRDTVS